MQRCYRFALQFGHGIGRQAPAQVNAAVATIVRNQAEVVALLPQAALHSPQQIVAVTNT